MNFTVAAKNLFVRAGFLLDFQILSLMSLRLIDLGAETIVILKFLRKVPFRVARAECWMRGRWSLML